VNSNFWVITCYYNPRRYQTKRDNYARFLEGLHKSALSVLVVELAFGNAAFELPETSHLIRVRGGDVLWQKERLLNLALSALPASCTFVAWMDCDILFENPRWLEGTLVALDRFPVVQPYSSVVRLPRREVIFSERGETWYSFGALAGSYPVLVTKGNLAVHGHPGFAWAARRELWQEIGFYDVCLTGAGDVLMSLGLVGDWLSGYVKSITGLGTPYHAHFVAWAKRAYARVGAQVGCVPGRALHLWHGDYENRQHDLRNDQFQRFAFDPIKDLRLAPNGVWEWASDKPSLHRWAEDFFGARNEDGDAASLTAVNKRMARSSNSAPSSPTR
jgi:hypothetical protein